MLTLAPLAPPERPPAPLPVPVQQPPPVGLAWLPVPEIAAWPDPQPGLDAVAPGLHGDDDEDDAIRTGAADAAATADAASAERHASSGPLSDAGPEALSEAASGPAPGQAPEAPPDPAPATHEPATAAGTDAEPAPAADGFDWPPSTRLRYALTGYWRGPVEGRAQVEWVRQGARYQVHLDIAIGPPFAPLITRQMSSDGQLGADGLVPRRYDELTRILWREPALLTVAFEPGSVRLAGGRRVARPPGVQDAASQLVQLTWGFMRDPARLRPGAVVTVPLALPRSVGDWVYDVREPELLATPVGEVEVLRLEPRRRARAGGDLVADLWFAPTLQYLPVRVMIRHGDEAWVDLVLDRLPEQAAAQPALPKRSP